MKNLVTNDRNREKRVERLIPATRMSAKRRKAARVTRRRLRRAGRATAEPTVASPPRPAAVLAVPAHAPGGIVDATARPLMVSRLLYTDPPTRFSINIFVWVFF